MTTFRPDVIFILVKERAFNTEINLSRATKFCTVAPGTLRCSYTFKTFAYHSLSKFLSKNLFLPQQGVSGYIKYTIPAQSV